MPAHARRRRGPSAPRCRPPCGYRGAAAAAQPTADASATSSQPPRPPSGGDLAWRIVGLANLYRLLLPPALYALAAAHPAHAQRRRQRSAAVHHGLRRLLGARRRCSPSAAAAAGRSRRVLVLANTLLDTRGDQRPALLQRRRRQRTGHSAGDPGGRHGAAGRRARRSLAVAAIAALGLLAQQILASRSGNVAARRTTIRSRGCSARCCSWWRCAPGRCPTACARARRWCAARSSIWPTSRSSRSTSCSTCARASWWSIPRTASVSSTSRRRRCSAMRSPCPGALIGEVSPRLLYLLTTWRDDERRGAARRGRHLRRRRRRARHPPALRAARRRRARPGDRVPRGHRRASPPRCSRPSSRRSAASRPASPTRSAIPSGAMSHAAQLLAESPALAAEDRRLTEIMQTQLHARQRHHRQRPAALAPRSAAARAAAARRLDRRFREEFCATVQLPRQRLHDRPGLRGRRGARRCAASCTRSSGICARTRHARAAARGRCADRAALRPARRHRPALPAGRRPRAGHRAAPTPSASSSRSSRAPQHGTGLGLFLARELAQANGATLLYEPREGGGSVFRVVFADPSRWTDWYS